MQKLVAQISCWGNKHWTVSRAPSHASHTLYLFSTLPSLLLLCSISPSYSIPSLLLSALLSVPVLSLLLLIFLSPLHSPFSRPTTPSSLSLLRSPFSPASTSLSPCFAPLSLPFHPLFSSCHCHVYLIPSPLSLSLLAPPLAPCLLSFSVSSSYLQPDSSFLPFPSPHLLLTFSPPDFLSSPVFLLLFFFSSLVPFHSFSPLSLLLTPFYLP